MANSKVKEEFFTGEDTHKIAKELLGKILVRVHENGRIQAGIIVETESYHGFDDLASHASKSRTTRNEVMFGEGGHYYVYLIYGMYWNLNIVTGKKEFPSAILIRALEPIYDTEIDLDNLNYKEKFRLASGPGKLCRWMEIDRELYGKSVEDEELFLIEVKDLMNAIARNEVTRQSLDQIASLSHAMTDVEIVESKRIGVDYAGDWTHKHWRYYIKDNKFVSRL